MKLEGELGAPANGLGTWEDPRSLTDNYSSAYVGPELGPD